MPQKVETKPLLGIPLALPPRTAALPGGGGDALTLLLDHPALAVPRLLGLPTTRLLVQLVQLPPQLVGPGVLLVLQGELTRAGQPHPHWQHAVGVTMKEPSSSSASPGSPNPKPGRPRCGPELVFRMEVKAAAREEVSAIQGCHWARIRRLPPGIRPSQARASPS